MTLTPWNYTADDHSQRTTGNVLATVQIWLTTAGKMWQITYLLHGAQHRLASGFAADHAAAQVAAESAFEAFKAKMGETWTILIAAAKTMADNRGGHASTAKGKITRERAERYDAALVAFKAASTAIMQYRA